jgi:exopolyphosphatase/guanosine-5'-triphosphate,3'-diphosphate pyrophosphatase
MTRRVAAVDCGTNSIRLLVADRLPNGRLVDIVRRMDIVRLGHGVDKTGRIAPAAMERTLAKCREYAGQCAELGAEAVRFVATSASRDASNAAEFVAGVREAVSMDMGCVRMTERYFSAASADPPTAEQVAAATADIDALVDEAARTVDLTGIGTLVGVAGTVTTLTAYALRLPAYQPDAIHLARLDLATTLATCAEVLAMTREERSAIPSMHPGRVDVIGAGALVWSRIVRRVAAGSAITDAVTSEHDILDGIALSLNGG